MKAYKIFRVIDGKIFSIAQYIYSKSKWGYIPYSKNGWNERLKRCGPITGFESINDVFRYLSIAYHEDSKYRVYEIEYIPSVDKNVWCSKEKNFYYAFAMGSILQKGTVLMNKFKIIKKVFEI